MIKQQKELLNRIKAHRKEQIKNFEDTLIKILKDDLKEIDLVLHNQMNIQQFYNNSKQRSDWINKFLSKNK